MTQTTPQRTASDDERTGSELQIALRHTHAPRKADRAGRHSGRRVNFNHRIADRHAAFIGNLHAQGCTACGACIVGGGKAEPCHDEEQDHGCQEKRSSHLASG